MRRSAWCVPFACGRERQRGYDLLSLGTKSVLARMSPVPEHLRFRLPAQVSQVRKLLSGLRRHAPDRVEQAEQPRRPIPVAQPPSPSPRRPVLVTRSSLPGPRHPVPRSPALPRPQHGCNDRHSAAGRLADGERLPGLVGDQIAASPSKSIWLSVGAKSDQIAPNTRAKLLNGSAASFGSCA